MIAKLIRWAEYPASVGALVVSIYFLFCGPGPDRTIYTAVSSTVIFIVATYFVIKIFLSTAPPDGEFGSSTPKPVQLSKRLFALGPVMFLVVGPAWPLISLRYSESPALIFIPALLIMLVGAIISGFGIYLWLVRRFARR
jgi:hypothetical protein